MFNRLFEAAGIKTRFLRFISVFFLTVILIMLVSNLMNYSFLSRYSKAFLRYDQISDFYDNIEKMNLGFVNYIYSRSEEELHFYKHYNQLALANLAKLKEEGTPELRFRFGLLENMVNSYMERAQGFVPGGSSAQDQTAYESFRHLEGLIADTFPGYSKMLTEAMKMEKQQLFHNWRVQLFWNLVSLSVILALSFSFSVSSVRSITRPIELLVDNIQRIQNGEFLFQPFESKCKEINILLISFEKMTEDLHNYIQAMKEKSQMEKRLIEKENENLKVSRILAETQFLTLQHKMNPHFLFNTLSTISKLAYIEGAAKSSDLMLRTASLLRYSLDMSTQISNLSLEVKCVNDYFEIQRKRIGDRIVFSIESAESFEEVPIPGMVLQPLIENCVIHGLKDVIAEGSVYVAVFREGGNIVMTIEDNGCGISPADLEKLNQSDEDFMDHKSIGIQNVRKRLELYYGEDCDFYIESEPNCGTYITITIPARTKGQYV